MMHLYILSGFLERTTRLIPNQLDLELIPPGVREALRSDPSLRSDRLNPYLAADSLPIISTISRHALAHSRHALAQRFMCSSSGNFSHSLPQLSHALAHASHTRDAIGP